MNHEIDLSKYQIRTDLAIEAIENIDEVFGIKRKEENIDNFKVTSVFVDDEGSKKINKKKGNYITIEFEDITDFNNKEKIKELFSQKLKNLINSLKVDSEKDILVIGLGNDKSTPDALGPMSVNNILVTRHLFLYNEIEEGFKKVAAINPGVMGQTGIETSDLIKAIVKAIKPSLVIAIDSLASQSIERVNKTIQLTDTGIHPGSGVGNSRKEISINTIGVPVIAIGVPTVVDAVTIVSDTINYMYKHYAFTKENIDNPMNKLTFGNINYLKKDIKTNIEDKKALLGMLGSLNELETRELIFEVLTPIGYNLMVTPKEVDFIIEKLSDIIGNGINKALHDKVNKL